MGYIAYVNTVSDNIATGTLFSASIHIGRLEICVAETIGRKEEKKISILKRP